MPISSNLLRQLNLSKTYKSLNLKKAFLNLFGLIALTIGVLDFYFGVFHFPFIYLVFDGLLILVVFVIDYRMFIEANALEKYCKALKYGEFEKAVDLGRIYYSIKRSGFLSFKGNDSHFEDDDEISQDIDAYSED